MKRTNTILSLMALLLLSAMPILAQDQMDKKMPMQHRKMQHRKKPSSSKAVYACDKCKVYYTSAQAKKLGYKDAMGHKLTKRSKAPSGYMMGSKSMLPNKNKGAGKDSASSKQASSMKCPVCKTMDMTATKTASNTQEVTIKGKTWYCCSGCDMSAIADKK